MAQTPTAADGEAAYTRLWQRIHVPAFFAKLAEQGLRPQDDAEAQAYLKMGMQLQAAESVNVKSASPVLAASAALDPLLEQLGLSQPAGWNNAELLKVASSLVAQPDVARDLTILRQMLGQAA